jgi:hypothetical protein
VAKVAGFGGPAIPIANLAVSSHSPLCHLDRSEAQWRDL